jgi:S-layer homology domain.
MNKRYSKLLVLALGASLLLPNVIANAATKTSADFTDLADLDAATKAKFDALLAAGIFEGDGTSNFGLNDKMNRAQFAKVASIIFGLDVNKDTRTSSFSDVGGDNGTNPWAIPYIEAAKKAGLMEGMADGIFNPAGEVTVSQFATVLVRALGIKPDTSMNPWYSEAIRQAIALGIIPADVDPKKSATRGDLANTSSDILENIEGLKKKAQELIDSKNDNGNKDDETKNPEDNSNNTNPTVPYTPSDTTAPSITAAAINGNAVTVTDGATGIISFKGTDKLTGGTLTVDEASTLTITSIEGISLSSFQSLSFTQNLAAGSNPLNLIDTLGALDPQNDGVTVSKLSQWDTDHNGLVITGTLRDGAGNSRTVQLTIKKDAPSLTAATINNNAVTLNGNNGSFTLASNAKLQNGTITVDEDAIFTLTSVQGVNLSGHSFNLTRELKAGTPASLDLASFLGAADSQGDGLSVSHLKLLSGASNSLVLTGTLTDALGYSNTITLTLNFN